MICDHDNLKRKTSDNESFTRWLAGYEGREGPCLTPLNPCLVPHLLCPCLMHFQHLCQCLASMSHTHVGCLLTLCTLVPMSCALMPMPHIHVLHPCPVFLHLLCPPQLHPCLAPSHPCLVPFHHLFWCLAPMFCTLSPFVSLCSCLVPFHPLHPHAHVSCPLYPSTHISHPLHPCLMLFLP